MLFFHRVELSELPKRDDPLFVGHFFPLQGMWWKKRKQRQQLIFSVAITWYKIAKRQIKSPGMLSDELILTGLTKQVREARSVIEHFFNITKLGFNFGDGVNFSPTVVSPKKLPDAYVYSIEKHLNKIVFHPGPKPTAKSLVQSTVRVRQDRASFILQKLKEEDRDDLLPAVRWLLESDSHVFFYRPAGKLQARDTSVWPIKAIEGWPGWLRTELFGTTIDLENAFCQFILSNLEKKYVDNPRLLKLKYPDLLQAAYNKQNFREEICRDILRRPLNEDNLSIVKRLIMALANGSNCSAGLMASDSRSEAVRIVKQCAPDLTPTEMISAGDRLQRIAKQFRSAKRDLCLYLLNAPPTRENLRKIFHSYFEWEKEARYSIWNATGQTGLMLHDGLDGVVTDMSSEELVELIARKTSLRVSVDVPEENENARISSTDDRVREGLGIEALWLFGF